MIFFLLTVIAPGCLAKPVHKKYSTKLFWGNPFSTYVSYDQFFIPLPLCAPVHIFDDSPSIPSVVYVLNGWPIFNQKTNNNIRISYSLKNVRKT